MAEHRQNRQSRQLTDDLTHVEFETSEDVEVLSTFDNMRLREDLIRGIYSYGKRAVDDN